MKANKKSRKNEFEKLKEIIKENFDDADCGLFNTRNFVGDPMATIFNGEFFTLDICYYWAYYEVFGTTDEEFEELKKIYKDLRKKKYE